MKITPHRLIPYLLALTIFHPVTMVSAQAVMSILEKAESLLGTPYHYGGMNIGGFDCSGFVAYLYQPITGNLPRSSSHLAKIGEFVPEGEWQPGDLLFYATGSDPGRINHVAIWHSDGKLIHSISDGPETGVVMTPAGAKYWKKRYVTARRVLPQDQLVENARSASDEGLLDENNQGTVNGDAMPKSSPWDDFDGFLRGDFEAWKEADQAEFESYQSSHSVPKL